MCLWVSFYSQEEKWFFSYILQRLIFVTVIPRVYLEVEIECSPLRSGHSVGPVVLHLSVFSSAMTSSTLTRRHYLRHGAWRVVCVQNAVTEYLMCLNRYNSTVTEYATRQTCWKPCNVPAKTDGISRRKEWQYVVTNNVGYYNLFSVVTVHHATIFWHVYPLLSNDRYLSKYTTASQTSVFPREQLDTATEERVFLCGPCRNVISRTVSEYKILKMDMFAV